MKPEELARRLQAQPFARVRERLMRDILFVVLANSQKRTPVKTGTLRRSETTRMEDSGAKGYVGTNIRYAPFVHDGTKFMDARPFFAEGIADSRPQVERLVERAGESYFRDLAS